jgi:purine-nucleoside phosphorylase
MTTPHLRAEPGDFASTVLMPGDPLRARYIAETFLDDARLVTDVRSMEGWTGTYNGAPISVQGSGMGVPSFQIYATELVKFFGVERIVRVGSCGALQTSLALGDVVVGIGAGTDSNCNQTRLQGRDLPAVADYQLLADTMAAAAELGIDPKVGTIFTSDFFYDPDPNTQVFELLARYGFLAVEMEAAGLYGLAAELGFAALAVCTVSDHIALDEQMSTEDRQTSFNDMMKLVLTALT